jgi:hypothetical protein
VRYSDLKKQQYEPQGSGTLLRPSWNEGIRWWLFVGPRQDSGETQGCSIDSTWSSEET